MKAYSTFNKKRTFEILVYYLLSVGIFEIAFCNTIFLTQLIRFNINFESYTFSFARIFIYIVFLTIIFLIKNKIIFYRYDLEKEKTKDKNIKKTIFPFLIIIIIFLIGLLYIILKDKLTIASLALLLIILLFFQFNFRFFGKNFIVNIMMICSIMFIYTILTDIYHPIDEKIHFISAYNLSQGNFNFDEAIFDKNFDNLPMVGNYNISPNFNKHYKIAQYHIENDLGMAPNKVSKFLYLPSAIGIKVAELFNGTVMDVFYYGRLFNAITTLILIYFILKLLPFKKIVFAVCITFPYFLLMSSSYSVDGIGVGIIFLLISYILKLYDSEKMIDLKNIMKIIFLIIMTLLFKSGVYIFVIFLLLLLPIKKMFKENKYIKYIFYFIVLLALGIFVYKILKINWNSGDIRGGDTNLLKQLIYLIKNPLFTLKVYVLHTLNTFLNMSYYHTLNPGIYYTSYSYYLTIPYLLLVIYLSLSDDSKNFNIKDKIIIIAISMLLFYISSTTMLLAYTEIGKEIIQGYQSRYTWPFIPLILVVFSNKKIKIVKSRNYEINVYYLLLFINYIYLCMSVFARTVKF